MKYNKVKKIANGEAHYKVVQDTNHDWLVQASTDSKQINAATAIPGYEIDKNFRFIGESAQKRKWRIHEKAFALRVGVEFMDEES